METWWKETQKSIDVVDHKGDLVAWACQAHATVTSALTNARIRDLGPPNAMHNIQRMQHAPQTMHWLIVAQKTNIGEFTIRYVMEDMVIEQQSCGEPCILFGTVFHIILVALKSPLYIVTSPSTWKHKGWRLSHRKPDMILKLFLSKGRQSVKGTAFQSIATSCIWHRNQSSGVLQNYTVCTF